MLIVIQLSGFDTYIVYININMYEIFYCDTTFDRNGPLKGFKEAEFMRKLY